MTSLFASQLREIAANTTNELDLKAQRAAHATSLIFERKVAGGQDFDTIYQICLEGFQDLCRLDARFAAFGQSLFSIQSKSQERAQLTKGQNKELDSVIEAYLNLVGERLLLKPAVKSVEWLVRRFRIHEYNTSFTILTFLPYYATPIFRNLLSILPSKIDPAFKFLYPYISGLSNPPRHAIAYSATNNDGFFAALNAQVISACGAECDYDRLLSFWTEIVTEAVAGRIDQARSGRKEIQNQREQDLLLKVLPILSDGLAMEGQASLKVSCYAIIMILASKLSLSQRVERSLMEAIAVGMSQETRSAAILCLSALLDGDASKSLPKVVVEQVIATEGTDVILQRLHTTYSIGPLVLALMKTLMQGTIKQDINSTLNLISRFLSLDVMDDQQKKAAASAISTYLRQSGEGIDAPSTLHPSLRSLIQLSLENSSDSKGQEEPSSNGKDEWTQDDSSSDVDMEDVSDKRIQMAWESAVADLSAQPSGKTFMSTERSPILPQLADAFTIAITSSKLMEEFKALPVIHAEEKSQEPLFFSFFIRLAMTGGSPRSRATAWKTISTSIASLTKPMDFQIFLPYILVGLADPSGNVRFQVASTVSEIRRRLPETGSEQNLHKISPVDFYDKGHQDDMQQLSSTDFAKIVERVLIPSLEEYVSDPNQITRTIAASLTSDPSHATISSDMSVLELKKNTRVAFFEFMLSHILLTPLYLVKCSLLRDLERSEKVGSIRKGTALLPALDQWCRLEAPVLNDLVQTDRITITETDSIMLSIVSPTDQEAVSSILKCLDHSSVNDRPSLLNAASLRVQSLWPRQNIEKQIFAIDTLLDIALNLSSDKMVISRFARELLRSLKYKGAVLSHCIETALTTEGFDSDQPPAKRRRTSQNQMASFDIASADLSQPIRRITLILELVDTSLPGPNAELMASLFHVLTWLQNVKSTIHSELGYLLSLTLGSLLTIIDQVRSSQQQELDLSSTRIDLIVDCARVTDNPQVQNTAILLVAALASIAPEHVLHSVMPIFTFMGSSLLKKDDEYSAHVVNQAIDLIIPPLIASLRRQKKDVVSGTSDLLSSFAAAFEHMPAARRLDLFDILIQRLGPLDSLYAMLAMLANRYPDNSDVETFVISISSRFAVEIQLQSYKRYLDLIVDCLKPKPVHARVLLGMPNEENDESFEVARNLCDALSRLLVRSSLKNTMSRVLRKDETRAKVIRHDFSALLEQTLSFTQNVASHPDLSQSANEVLTSLLELLPLSELVIVVERLINRPGDRLRTKALHLLESRLKINAGKDSSAHKTTLALLPRLAEVVQESAEPRLRHAAIACIDQICEKLGRKDPSAVTAIATAISGPACLSSTDIRLSTMALLCLSSMVDVLKEEVIPILPETIGRVFDLLSLSLSESKEEPQLHNSAFAFLGALLTHVPFMLSDAHVDALLKAALESAKLGPECVEARSDTMQLLARNVDIKRIIAAIGRMWPDAVANGTEAVMQTLSVLNGVIESKTKSAIISNNENLHGLLLEALDLRRIQLKNVTDDSYSEEEVSQIEDRLNEITIKMIYKLNDTIFRPLFSRTVEWATKAQDLSNASASDTELRQLTLFRFLTLFFSTLKSIVTSYASSIIDPATSFLKSYDPSFYAKSPYSFTLYSSILSALNSTFTHDADDFFAIPSNFNSLCGPLIQQLTRFTTSSLIRTHLGPHLLPTITSFAIALTSSPPHLKTLNQQLCALRSAESPSVRLASVRVQAALTKELGEEWLANSGEMMVYIQRMLEDEDEKVESETRTWVAEVQEVLGEDVGEMLQN